MTRDQILSMAWNSGVHIPPKSSENREKAIEPLLKFAELVAKQKRDEIIQQIESQIDEDRELYAIKRADEAQKQLDIEEEVLHLQNYSNIRLWNNAHEEMIEAITAKGDE